jgi:hypothetical protein
VRWQFGDEALPRLVVRVKRNPLTATVSIGVGELPTNHPLELALDVLCDRGAVDHQDLLSGTWDAVRRIVVATEQQWLSPGVAHVRQLVDWYGLHQHELNTRSRG